MAATSPAGRLESLPVRPCPIATWPDRGGSAFRERSIYPTVSRWSAATRCRALRERHGERLHRRGVGGIVVVSLHAQRVRAARGALDQEGVRGLGQPDGLAGSIEEEVDFLDRLVIGRRGGPQHAA